MKRTILSAVAASMLAVPVMAAPPPWAPANGYRAQNAYEQGYRQGYYQGVRYDDRDDRREWREDRREWRQERRERRDDRRYQSQAHKQYLKDRHAEYLRDRYGYAGKAEQRDYYASYWRDPRQRAYYENRWNGRNGYADSGLRYWQANDGRYYCRRSNGTTGLLIGALGGGTLGNLIAGRGDKLLGSVIGGAAGAIIGREIDKGNVRCG